MAREKHGALLDSEILAEVYLELIGGRQPTMSLVSQQEGQSTAQGNWTPRPRPEPLPSRLTEEEAAAHAAFVETLGDGATWKTGG